MELGKSGYTDIANTEFKIFKITPSQQVQFEGAEADVSINVTKQNVHSTEPVTWFYKKAGKWAPLPIHLNSDGEEMDLAPDYGTLTVPKDYQIWNTSVSIRAELHDVDGNLYYDETTLYRLGDKTGVQIVLSNEVAQLQRNKQGQFNLSDLSFSYEVYNNKTKLYEGDAENQFTLKYSIEDAELAKNGNMYTVSSISNTFNQEIQARLSFTVRILGEKNTIRTAYFNINNLITGPRPYVSDDKATIEYSNKGEAAPVEIKIGMIDNGKFAPLEKYSVNVSNISGASHKLRQEADHYVLEILNLLQDETEATVSFSTSSGEYANKVIDIKRRAERLPTMSFKTNPSRVTFLYDEKQVITTPYFDIELDLKYGSENLIGNDLVDDGGISFGFTADAGVIVDKLSDTTYRINVSNEVLYESNKNKIFKSSFHADVKLKGEPAVRLETILSVDTATDPSVVNTFVSRIDGVASDVGTVTETVSTISQTMNQISISVEGVIEEMQGKVEGVRVEYALSASQANAPTSGWQTEMPVVPTGYFVWTRTVTVINGENSYSGAMCITGAQGDTGDGIKSIEERYIAYSSATTTPPNPWSEWSTTIPAMDGANKKYLWAWEIITYTSGSTTDLKKLISIYGDEGNGIDSVTNFYLVSNKNTGITTSTAGWSQEVKATSPETPYLWNYEEIKYTKVSTIKKTTPAIIGTHGAQGPIGIPGTDAKLVVLTGEQVFKYASGATTPTPATIKISATTTNVTGTPTFVWKTRPPGSTTETVVSGQTGSSLNVAHNASQWGSHKQLTYICECSGVRDEITIVKVYDGDKGSSGVGISRTEEVYAANSSSVTPPTSWSTTIPTMDASSKKYLWMKEVTYYTDDSQSPARTRVIAVYGNTGGQGVGVDSITNYFLASDKSSGITNTTSGFTTTAQLTSPTKKYLWNYEEISYTDGAKSKTDAVVIGVHGEPGADAYTVILSNENHSFPGGDTGAIEATTTTQLTVYKGTNVISPSSVTVTPPTGMTYSIVGNTITFNTTTGLSALSGMVPIVVTVDGKQFTKHFTYVIAVKSRGISSIKPKYLASSASTGVTTATAGWTDAVQSTTTTKKYLWNYEIISYTDGGTPTNTLPVIIGTHGSAGQDGTGISNVVEKYKATSSNVAPAHTDTGWAASIPTLNNSTAKYLWNWEQITFTSSSVATKNTVKLIAVYGDTGDSAKQVFISGEQVFKYSENFSIGPEPATIQLSATLAGTSGYQWAYRQAGSSTVTNISGATSSTYSLSPNDSIWGGKKQITIRCTSGGAQDEITVMKVSDGATGNTGPQGPQGDKGDIGASGRGIVSIVETYQASSSNTVTPTGTWSSTMPTLNATSAKYLWNREVINYTIGNPDTFYKVIAAYGDTGSTGTGISTITNYYLASASASGVTNATAGFTTSIQTTDINKRYLWNYEEITYTSGSKQKTLATIIGTHGATGPQGPSGPQGIQGPNGANGQSQYFHVRYSKAADGSNMTPEATGATYMGTAVTTTSAPPTAASSYKWTKILGDQGPQGNVGTAGAPGANGQTSYLHIKYSDNGTSFTANNGETPGKWIGQYVDFTEADSTSFSAYTWAKVEGPAGTPAKYVVVTGEQAFKYAAGASTPTPATLTLSATLTGTTGYQWSYRVPGSQTATAISGATAQTYALAHNFSGWGSHNQLTLRCTSGGVYDEITVIKVRDGNTGASGSNGADAYTVVLTNEAHSFPGGTTAANAGSASTSAIVYKGTTRINATIVNPVSTSLPAGMTSAVSGANTQTPTATFTVTTSMSTPGGTIPLTIQADGKSFVKNFTYAIAFKGNTGSTGAAGADGYSVVLSNESHSFAGGTTAALAGYVDVEVIAYKGGTRIASTIGSITGAPAGMTVGAPTNNGTTTAKVRISATTSMTSANGTLNIPITVDGKSFTKQFTYSIAFKGAQGVPGVQGPAGANGQTTYTWVKYSNSSNGSSMVDVPNGHSYIGMAYNKTTATESTNAADYTWTLFKGPQGVQGPAGPNGQATYTWIKYADSPTTGMSDNPSGKKYFGVAHNKTTATEGTNYSDYSWSLVQGAAGQSVTSITPQYILSTSSTTAPSPTANWLDTPPKWVEGQFMWTRSKVVYANPTETKYVGVFCDSSWLAIKEVSAEWKTELGQLTGTVTEISNMEIGGRNYVLDSKRVVTNNEYCIASYGVSEYLIAGQKYTITMKVSPAQGVENYGMYLSGGYARNGTLQVNGVGEQIVSGTFIANYADGRTPADSPGHARPAFYRFPNNGTVTSNSTVHWVKIESGDRSTDWTPAPEDDDTMIGLNKWKRVRYPKQLASAAAYPQFSDISGVAPNYSDEYSDNTNLVSGITGDYFILHAYTNVYVSGDKNITLTPSSAIDDTFTSFLNGRQVSTVESTQTTTFALKKGWNTIEFLFYEHAGGEIFGFTQKISTLVDKMAYGVSNGTSNSTETRISSAEIKLTPREIALAVSSNINGGTALDTTSMTIASGLVTIKNGALRIQNKGGTPVLYANTNGDLTLQGTIYATSGGVGGFTLADGKIYGTKVGMGRSGTAYAFWAGADGNGSTAPFRVGHDGNVMMTKAIIADSAGATVVSSSGINASKINAGTLSATYVRGGKLSAANGAVEWDLNNSFLKYNSPANCTEYIKNGWKVGTKVGNIFSEKLNKEIGASYLYAETSNIATSAQVMCLAEEQLINLQADKISFYDAGNNGKRGLHVYTTGQERWSGSIVPWTAGTSEIGSGSHPMYSVRAENIVDTPNTLSIMRNFSSTKAFSSFSARELVDATPVVTTYVGNYDTNTIKQSDDTPELARVSIDFTGLRLRKSVDSTLLFTEQGDMTLNTEIAILWKATQEQSAELKTLQQENQTLKDELASLTALVNELAQKIN